MSHPIDTASVLIVPDFSKFGPAVESGIKAPFAQVDASVEAIIEAMEVQFQDLAKSIITSFEESTAAITTSLAGIEDEVAGVADSLSLQFNEAQASVDHSFDEMRINASANLDAIDVKSAESAGLLSGSFAKVAPLLLLAGGAAATGLGAVATFGLKSAASLEQTKIAFDSLTGSAAKGQAQFVALQQFANVTPFTFNDLTTAAKRFDAFSASIKVNQDQLIPWLTTIGNVVSETGGGAQAFDSITLALGQTAGQGKLTLGNLDQINNAIPGFSAVAAIASVRGETTAQVMQEISAGSISAAQGIPQLIQGMKQFPGAAGAMAKQANTLLGVFSTFHDVVSQALSNAFTPVIPAIKASLTQVTPIIGQAVQQIAPALGKLLSSALPLIGNLLKGIVPILTPLINGLTTAFDALGPSLQPLGEALGAIVQALSPLIPVLSGVAVQILQALTPAILELAPVIAQLAPVIGEVAVALVPFVQLFAQLLPIILPLVDPIIKLVTWVGKNVDVFRDLAVIIGTIIGLMKIYEATLLVAEGIEAAIALATKAWTAAQVLLDAAMDANPIGLVVVAIAALVAGIVIVATKTRFFQDAWRDVWGFMKVVAAWFAGPFVNFFMDIGHWFATDFVGFFVHAWDNIKGAFDAAVNWVAGRIARFIISIQNIRNRIVGAAKGMFDGVINAFKSAINWIISRWNNLGFHLTIPKSILGISIPGGGATVGFDTPNIPLLAKGGTATSGGFAVVGDQGPELISMRKGATVTPLNGNGGPIFGPGSIVININGDVSAQKAFNIGQQVGQGINAALQARDVRNTVRTM